VPPSSVHPTSTPATGLSSSSSINNRGDFQPNAQDLELASKYARFIVSSLQFDDVPAAVKNARLVLKHLTGQDR
jgi:hypothetical protein